MLFAFISAAFMPFFIAAAETTTMTMTQFLANATEVVSWLWGQVGTVSSTVMGNPMLAVTFYIFIGGAAIGFFGRLIHI